MKHKEEKTKTSCRFEHLLLIQRDQLRTQAQKKKD